MTAPRLVNRLGLTERGTMHQARLVFHVIERTGVEDAPVVPQDGIPHLPYVAVLVGCLAGVLGQGPDKGPGLPTL